MTDRDGDTVCASVGDPDSKSDEEIDVSCVGDLALGVDDKVGEATLRVIDGVALSVCVNDVSFVGLAVAESESDEDRDNVADEVREP